jgi:hypothetical protein
MPPSFLGLFALRVYNYIVQVNKELEFSSVLSFTSRLKRFYPQIEIYSIRIAVSRLQQPMDATKLDLVTFCPNIQRDIIDG